MLSSHQASADVRFGPRPMPMRKPDHSGHRSGQRKCVHECVQLPTATPAAAPKQPEPRDRAQHRIASTIQHPTSMGAK